MATNPSLSASTASAPDSLGRFAERDTRAGSQVELFQLKSQQYDTLLAKLADLEQLREQSQRHHTDETRQLQTQLQQLRTLLGESVGEILRATGG
jgi:hypothetical protein